MERIRTAIIDDEVHAAETLQWEIGRSCKEVEVKRIFNSPVEAQKEISNEEYDLIFLDIEMPEMNGFDFLKSISDFQGGVIFTTAYDQFAIDAIRHSAIDYLLKPVNHQDIRTAVDRYIDQKSQRISNENLDSLFQFLGQNKLGRVAIPTPNGFEFYEPDAILRCESDSNYSTIFFTSGEKKVLTKTLKELEEILTPHGFIRIHHSHLVNGEAIKSYVRSDGGYVVLSDGSQLSVSRGRKDDLLSRF